MIRMIDRYSGVVMWVHESRVDEYKARGHKLAPAAKSTKAPKKTAKK